MRRAIGARLLQGVIAWVFLTAGVMKLLEGTSSLHASIAHVGWIPVAWNARIAGALPAIEIGLGAWILSGWRSRLAAAVTLVALPVFTSSLVSLGFRFGWRQDCACTPVLSPSSIGAAIVRNAILTAACVWLIRSPRTRMPPARARQLA